MIIGIDIRSLMDKNYSGVSEFTYNLICGLSKLDHENEYRLFYNSAKNLGDRIPDFMPDIKVYKKKFPNKIFNYILQKIIAYPKIDKYLDAEVFLSPHLNFLSLSDESFKILVIHDLSFLIDPEFFSLRKNIWHKMINSKKFSKRFDKIITVSKNTKADVVRLLGVPDEKVEVIYPGISETFKPLSETDESLLKIRNKYGLSDDFFLFIGTVEPRKNVLGLINAFEAYCRKYPSSESDLVIAGKKGWKSKDIYSCWKKSKYRHRIRFLGYVDKEDKLYIYNLAKIFIYPSFYEGFGFPPLEAMACGIPAIVSNLSSLPEVAGDSALTVNPHNINDLVYAMESLANDKTLYEKFREKGLDRTKEFNWKTTAEKYIEIFNKK